MSGIADREQLAVLVHEVRSPVAAISAIAEALVEEDLEPESLRELVRLALGACRSLERIAVGAALGSLRLESVDVAEVVSDAVAAAVLQGARVRSEVADETPLVTADRQRLRQAVDNLIENAIVHADSEDEIVVSARRDGDFVLVSVRDSGRGIPAGEQARIFDRGSRLDPTRPGTGLGLAVVRAILQAHGGSVTVDSAPGEGSTFVIALRTPPG